MSSRTGELLVKLGKLSQDQLLKAEESRQSQGITLLSAIVRNGFLSESEIVSSLGGYYSLKVADLENVTPQEEAVRAVPHDLATKHTIYPLDLSNNTLTVAMVDPSNILALNDVKFVTGFNIQINIAGESQIKAAIEKTYESAVSYDSIFESFEEGDNVEVISTEDELDLAAVERASEDAPVVKLVNAILTDAIKKRASDIHIEPYEKTFRVRFRIDGVLYEIMKPPPKLKAAITSRIKIMADLDIAERRLPQDGRIKLKLGNKREMDFRVSVLPGLFGEKVVLRLLDKTNLQTDLTKLGFFASQMESFQDSISKPFGLILVTGPTGSGKTTTLYSALSELNKPTVNISTAEDPVEFNLHGINQVQMHEDIGLNFAAALRSFLRQDPDIVMVGEIRDYETAEIAIKASLTGHLVLSTLHTNDAPSTINRLLNMGIEPFLVASSINIVVAQRLARKVCENCKDQFDVNPEVLVNIGISPTEARHIKVYYGKGCEKCSGTGYKGRIALYECMVMTEELKEFVLNGASAAEIKREAVRQGMLTLRMSGLEFLKMGTTTIEEVLRVTTTD